MTNEVTAMHAMEDLIGGNATARVARGKLEPVCLGSASEASLVNDRLYESVFEQDYGVLWAYLRPTCPPKFTPELMSGLRRAQREIRERVKQELAGGHPNRLRYQVFASRISGIFSLGGDLAFFRRCIATNDRASLRQYATTCVDVVYANATNYDLPVTTISLVQGQALGGGFEAALAANVVVAERQCKMGLPEVLFNLFPGMGAYQLLTRRLSPVQAERFIESGRTYSAEELYDMGLVDVLADSGKGEDAVRAYIRSHDRHFNGRHGLRVDVWLDTAFSLTPKDEQTMSYLLRAQSRLEA